MAAAAFDDLRRHDDLRGEKGPLIMQLWWAGVCVALPPGADVLLLVSSGLFCRVIIPHQNAVLAVVVVRWIKCLFVWGPLKEKRFGGEKKKKRKNTTDDVSFYPKRHNIPLQRKIKDSRHEGYKKV